jgi:type IV secretion system protein VirB6
MFERLLTHFNGVLATYWLDAAAGVISAITPVAITMATIYVVLWGFSLFFGLVQEPVMDGVMRIVKLSAIVGIALSSGYYAAFLGNLLWGLPDGLISAVSGGGTSTSAAGMDALFDKFYELYQALNEKAQADSSFGIPSLPLLIQAYATLISGGLLVGYAVFLYLAGKMAAAALLSIGPVTILMMMFKPTQRFFESWVSATVTAGLIAVFGAVTVGMSFAFINSYMSSAAALPSSPDLGLAEGIGSVLYALISLIILWQVPTLAQATGGAISIGTMGAVKGTFDKAKGAAGGGYNALRGNTMADARFSRKKRAEMNDWAKKNPGVAARSLRAPAAIYNRVTGRKPAQPNTISAVPTEDKKTGT